MVYIEKELQLLLCYFTVVKTAFSNFNTVGNNSLELTDTVIWSPRFRLIHTYTHSDSWTIGKNGQYTTDCAKWEITIAYTFHYMFDR